MGWKSGLIDGTWQVLSTNCQHISWALRWLTGLLCLYIIVDPFGGQWECGQYDIMVTVEWAVLLIIHIDLKETALWGGATCYYQVICWLYLKILAFLLIILQMNQNQLQQSLIGSNKLLVGMSREKTTPQHMVGKRQGKQPYNRRASKKCGELYNNKCSKQEATMKQ